LYWNKVVQLTHSNYDYLFNYLEKIASINIQLSFKLGEDFIAKSELEEKWDLVVKTIKTIYKFIPQKNKEPKSMELRQKLINAYRNLYKNNSNFDDCIKRSQMNQSWKNLYDAIEIFEKYILFDKGNYVLPSKTWYRLYLRY